MAEDRIEPCRAATKGSGDPLRVLLLAVTQRRLLVLTVSLALIPISPAWTGEAGKPLATLTPERIEMGSFYSGAQLRIDGRVGSGSQAIVVVRGADKDEIFNKKVRLGPIWINSGSIHILGAPSLFLCFSPGPVSAILDPEVVRERKLAEAAIVGGLRIGPEQEREMDARMRSDFLNLKMEDGLYHVYPDGLKMGEPETGVVPFSVELAWPKKAPPASYTVQVLECRGRAVVAESTFPLEVVKVGFPRSFAILAGENAVAYGLVAVLAAACAGFAIDFLAAMLFGKKRRVAH